MPNPSGVYTNPVTGAIFGWPQPDATGRNFNAVHMALIPKGPYRGMLFVMNRDERVIAQWPGSGTTDYYVFQCYAIVDPGDNLVSGIRCRNFLLPIAVYDPNPIPTPQNPRPAVQDLFCSGHVWSPYGDLIIVGGTDYLPSFGTNYSGGFLTYAWNPRLPVQNFPFASGAPFYAPASPLLFSGFWERGPELECPRWYPTAVLTHRLNRAPASDATAPPRERVLVLGSIAGPQIPGGPTFPLPPENSYEALVIKAEADVGVTALAIDDTPPPSGTTNIRTWLGCGTTAGANVDWLDEYPRCHLLSTGEIFFSGYAPRGAWIDHDGPPFTTGGGPGMWTQVAGQPGQPVGTYSANWQAVRHDGSAVLFPNLGGSHDQILRIGGANQIAGPTTETMESIAAGGTDTWHPGKPLLVADGLPDGSRAFLNVVILPTGALLALGGRYQDGASVKGNCYSPQLFENGDWTVLDPNPTPSKRTYHSTAVLLPDGRVFLGGGDDRDFDYEIFSPAYLKDPVNRPVNPVWQTPAPTLDPTFDALVLDRNTPYTVHFDRLPFGQTITKAVLIAPGSVTHHSDMSQRYVELKTGVTNGHIVDIECNEPETVVPRGIYMLFAVSNSSVSEAIWVMFQ